MQYMLLIHHEADNLSAAELPQMMQEYMTFTQDLVKSGKFKAGDRLEPTETKEQLGGYYTVDAKDLDEAVAIAARIPGARTGSIEVRTIAIMPAR